MGESGFSRHEIKKEKYSACSGFRSSYRFTLPGDVDIEGVSYEELPPEDEPAPSPREKGRRRQQELLGLVDFAE